MHTTLATQSQSLKGPTIFVYVISILAGLAAGGIVASFCWSGSTSREIFNWPAGAGYIGLIAGPIGGVVAAWFWTKRMIRHIRNQAAAWKKIVFGILWGLLAGWIGAIVLWLIIGFFFAGIAYKHFFLEVPIVAAVGIAYFGSIGGLGAGVICGCVWALWTRPKK